MFHRLRAYALAGFSLFSIAAYADPLVFSSINFPGSDSTDALGINNTGQIVGYYTAAGPYHGYLLNGGVFSTFDVPGSSGTIPLSINGAGDIVGTFFNGGTWHGFLLSGGVYSILDPPGSTLTQAWDINNSGQIVGQYLDGGGGSHGFLLSGGVYTTIDFPAAQGGAGGNIAEGINDAAQISGRYCSSTLCQGFYFDGTNYFSIPIGSFDTSVYDVNNLGQLAGGASAGGTSSHGFIINSGIVSPIDFPGASATVVRKINDVGDLVGTYADSSGVLHGYLAKADTTGPLTTNVQASPDPVAINTSSNLTAHVDDTTTGNSNIASAEYNIDGGPSFPMNAADSTFDQPAEDVTTLVPGFSSTSVYNLCVRGTDAAGNTGATTCTMLPVYDPSAGFVTGGGGIDSPTSKDFVNTSAAGPASFGFVSKYQKGASTPSGNFEFQFKAGNLNFHSTSMDWLVVTGQPRAQFQGTGTINGTGACKYQVDAWDNSFPSANGPVDAFGIKIYACNSGGDANGNRYSIDATPLSKGSIIIHK